MADPDASLAPVSTTAGRWSIWLAVGSFLVVLVFQTAWSFLILIPQWRLVGGEPDPAYVLQYDVGTALFSVTGLVLAIAAVAFGAKSIAGANPLPRDHAGRKGALVRGWIGICLGALLAVHSINMLSTVG